MSSFALESRASDDDDWAEVQFRDGIARFEARDFSAAASAFERAWTLSKQERFLWNESLAELNGGHAAEAYGHLQTCLRQPDLTAPHAEQIRCAMAHARTKVLLLAITAPDGATIALDGSPIGVTPLADMLVAVDPGWAHVLSAQFHGATAIQTVDARAPGEVAITLAPNAAQSAHVVPPAADEASRPGPLRTIVSGSAVVLGVGAAVAAAVFYFNSRSEADQTASLVAQADVEQPNVPPESACAYVKSKTCSDLDSIAHAQVDDQNKAVGFGIAAGGLLLAGAAAYVFWPRTPSAPTVAVAPLVTRTECGAAFRFSF